MLFNSIDFAIFLPIVFFCYWFIFNKKLRLQNLFLVIASYVFYGWWDWRFLSLLALSTLIDFFAAGFIHKQIKPNRKKLGLAISIVVNLGVLCFFKYSNFFIESLVTTFTLFGQTLQSSTLQIILPVGISFYTFQTLGYVIDVYRGKLYPATDLISFTAFVSFFPQLVAGPIERATNLLPQFYQQRSFNYPQAANGMKQILWGLFKKLVIADNCGVFADLIFDHSTGQSGSTLAIGTVFFAFQIYGDFSGYSDMAIGIGKLFGFTLMQNFAYPYFSGNPVDFWRRWHISLSTWFRDYVYIPLGGNQGSTLKNSRNIMITFLLSGFWHGASWKFIAWGGVNGIALIPWLSARKKKGEMNTASTERPISTPRSTIGVILTFLFICLGWVFFRAHSLHHAFEYFGGIFHPSLFSVPQLPRFALITLLFVLILILAEWLGQMHDFALEKLDNKQPRFIRWLVYSLLLFLIGMYMQTEETPFIYFQF